MMRPDIEALSAKYGDDSLVNLGHIKNVRELLAYVLELERILKTWKPDEVPNEPC
jgi:hypothetical protein